jgi:hypothetical protein
VVGALSTGITGTANAVSYAPAHVTQMTTGNGTALIGQTLTWQVSVTTALGSIYTITSTQGQTMTDDWVKWNRIMVAAAQTTATTTWTTWCDDDCHREKAEAMRAWTRWNDRGHDDGEIWVAEQPLIQRATPAEVAAIRADAAKRVAEADVAARKAEDLLRRELTPEQREDLEKKSCFYLETIGKDGKRRKYRIDRGTHGNIKLLDDKGSIQGTFCVQPDGVPVADSMLAQKLWIENNEAGFLKVANFTRRLAQ